MTVGVGVDDDRRAAMCDVIRMCPLHESRLMKESLERRRWRHRSTRAMRRPLALVLRDDQARALVAASTAAVDASDDRGRRARDADVLEVKLRAIQDNVKTSHLGRDVQGSQAGASSGEFHTYREQRRRERARLDAMEREAVAAADAAAREAKLDAARDALETKTAKNRAKRAKLKAKLKAKRAKTKSGGVGDGGVEEGGEDDVA